MKTIGIEAFLTWAYREELPKAEAPGSGEGAIVMGNGWDSVAQQGELMAECVSDGRPNSYGVIPLSAWYGSPPHPDAFAAHAAVCDLAKVELDVPNGWAPLAHLGLTPEEADDAVRRALLRVAVRQGDIWRLRCKPAELVRRFAILGGAPCWQTDVPKRRFVSANGKPLWFRMIQLTNHLGRQETREVEGRNPRTKRPYPGAYRRTVLEPDPVFAAIDRAEYEVWHAALGLLVEVLNEPGVLVAHQLSPSLAPARPWENIAASNTAA